MNVDRPQPGDCEKSGRKQLPVGRDNKHIGLQGFQFLKRFRGIDVEGLSDQNMAIKGSPFDRRLTVLVFARPSPFRLRVESGDLVRSIQQPKKRGEREISRAEHHQRERRKLGHICGRPESGRRMENTLR